MTMMMPPTPDPRPFRCYFSNTSHPFTVIASRLKYYTKQKAIEFYIYEGEWGEHSPVARCNLTIYDDGTAQCTYSQPDYPLHFSDRTGVKNFAEVLDKLYDWAEEMLKEE
jgi:hypothetical protein